MKLHLLLLAQTSVFAVNRHYESQYGFVYAKRHGLDQNPLGEGSACNLVYEDYFYELVTDYDFNRVY